MNDMERQALARNNIIALRNFYGESKTDLASAIGYNGPNAIWNLESGKQRIPEDIMAKIETHYMLPRGSLSTEDFTDIQSFRIPHQKSELKDLALAITPLVTSESAEKDPSFCKAYTMHTALFDISSSISNDDLSIEEIINTYAESYDENGTIESLINLVSLFINLAASQNNEWAIKFAEGILSYGHIMSDKSLSKKERKKLFEPFLKRASAEESDFGEESDSKSLDDLVVDSLKEIIKNGVYGDIAYYYMALRYFFNSVNNDEDYPENQKIGTEMLMCLSQLDNPYAKAFLKAQVVCYSD